MKFLHRILVSLIFALVMAGGPAAWAQESPKEAARAATENFMGSTGSWRYDGYSNFYGLPCQIQVDVSDQGMEIQLTGGTVPGSAVIFEFRYTLNPNHVVRQKVMEQVGERLRLGGERRVTYRGEQLYAPQRVSLKKRDGKLHSVYLFDWEGGEYTFSMTCVVAQN